MLFKSRLSKANTKSSGFTLIEAVVATSVFAFVVSGILGVYVSITRLDTRIRAQNAVASDGRFIMDFFAKEIRNGRIDYASYVGGRVCENSCGSMTTFIPTQIRLISQSGEPMHIYFWNRRTNSQMTAHTCSGASDFCDIRLTKPSGTTRFNSEKVRVTRFISYVTPENDPFVRNALGVYNYNVQPHVTVILELQSMHNPRDRVSLKLESTFSTLYYPPRP